MAIHRHDNHKSANALMEWTYEKRQTKFMWIPPCRKQLERDGDYD